MKKMVPESKVRKIINRFTPEMLKEYRKDLSEELKSAEKWSDEMLKENLKLVYDTERSGMDYLSDLRMRQDILGR